jgi:hypothetical protein
VGGRSGGDVGCLQGCCEGMSMKVLFLHCASDLYGASRCLLRFVERFQSEGHTAVIVMPEDGPLRARLAHLTR